MSENFFYWWIGWAIFGIASFLFLRFNKNARLKRVVYPLIQIFATVYFLFVVWKMVGNDIGPVVYVFSVIAIIIGIANYRSVVFCDSCGAMSYSGTPFKRPVECSQCGSKWV